LDKIVITEKYRVSHFNLSPKNFCTFVFLIKKKDKNCLKGKYDPDTNDVIDIIALNVHKEIWVSPILISIAKLKPMAKIFSFELLSQSNVIGMESISQISIFNLPCFYGILCSFE